MAADVTASNPAKVSTRALLVEDDEALGAALTEYLRLSDIQVDWVRSGLEFYAQVSQGPEFYVAIVDIGLPDQSGLVLADYIRRNTHASVIVLTANDSSRYSAESYRLGVDLFMAKPVDNDVLVAAVTSMALRYRQRAGGVTEEGLPAQTTSTVLSASTSSSSSLPTGHWAINRRRRHLVTPKGEVVELTRQELTFLQMLANGDDQRAERAKELDALYGRDDESAQRALDTMISRLRRKVSSVTGDAAPILTDYGLGHSFSEPLVFVAI